MVAPNRDDRREAPGVAFDRHVVRGADEHRSRVCGLVGELREVEREATAATTEAKVADVVPILDRPQETRLRGSSKAAVDVGSEHAHT